jgi:hypothetical protein
MYDLDTIQMHHTHHVHQTTLLERQKTHYHSCGITSRDRSAEGDFCTTHHTSGMHEKMSDQRANQACKQTIWTHTACPNIRNTSRSCVDAPCSRWARQTVSARTRPDRVSNNPHTTSLYAVFSYAMEDICRTMRKHTSGGREV